MRKLTIAIYSAALVMLFFSCSKQNGDNKVPAVSTGDMDPRVNELLGKMSLEEKIGQMTHVNLNVILKDGYASKDASIDPALLDTAVLKYKVGSILNAVPGALPVEKWHS